MQKTLQIFILFFTTGYLFGSSADSTKIYKLNTSNIFIELEDSLLDESQKYYFKNNLGNIGSAIQDLILSRENLNPGLNYGKSHFENYFFKVNYKHLKVYRPYTDLKYIVGSKKEQFFSFLHSQNINKNLNFAVYFNRIRSEGFYLKQNTNLNSVGASYNYLSGTGKYSLKGNFIFNSLKSIENGGIRNDSTFENNIFNDKKLIPVNLSSAQKKIRNKSAFTEQNYFFQKNDSTKSLKGYLFNSILVEDNSWLYKDDLPSAGFYKNIFNDSLKTYDSTYFYNIENKVGYGISKGKLKGVSLYLKNQIARVKQNEIDSAFNNFIIGSEIKYSILKDSSITGLGNFEYVAAGNNINNYLGSFALEKRVSKNSISFTSNFSHTSPDFIHTNYSSNHFKWKNNFDKQTSLLNELSFSSRPIQAGIKMNYYKNFTFFNSLGEPFQRKKLFNIFSSYLRNKISAGNWKFINYLTYQYSANSAPIRIPSFIVETSILYENSLFKKALKTQVGVDILYFSDFFANSYMPAISQFYLQNEKKVGNYPFIDFFINLKIKSVRLFFKIEHINSGLTGSNYFLAPHYPAPDRAFKFGVNWKFHN